MTSTSPRVALVSIPLMARSGVYRSTHDLVRAANDAGQNWSAVIGMRPDAPGDPRITPGVREFEFTARGREGVREICRIVESAPELEEADVIISLISQSDVALSRSTVRDGRKWVAWVRGMPWPGTGEQNALRTLLLKWVETRALRSADEVWATTPVLAEQFASARHAEIVPAGIAPVERTSWGLSGEGPLVWAGRVDTDKRPELFAEIVRQTAHAGRIFGEGPLFAALSKQPIEGLVWEGWSDSRSLWDGASIFVGTSSREAFGRSAVEAAAAGVPVVIGAEYGAAPLLFTDPDLRAACVIESDDPDQWANAVQRLLDDGELRTAASEHVHSNAKQLTIAASMASASRRAVALTTTRQRA